jgi:uncharacterized protein (DUF885 family)
MKQPMTDHEPENDASRGFTRLAEDILEFLTAQFPVCMASDEFHFFPQARARIVDWSRWDDFSPDAMTEAIARLKQWTRSLDRQTPGLSSFDRIVESAMLRRVLQTLSEQFEWVRVQNAQPTFYLTIVGIGLAEALESGERAFTARLEHLPGFLHQAESNLIRIPRLFRDLGLDMLGKQMAWLDSLTLPDTCRPPVFDAYRRLHLHLENALVHEAYLPEVDLYKRIAFAHMGCFLSSDDIAAELNREIEETRSALERFAADSCGKQWQAVVEGLPRPPAPAEGVGNIYHGVISDLASHCIQQQLVSEELVYRCPIAVETIPDYMHPVRSSAAYSMPPRHPPRGGTFFIAATGKHAAVPVDYRLLAAHETYPGHHLLDTCRWRQTRLVRRHVEFPVFYEGWASFAEELLFDTGFFSGAAEQMLMAKRRFWRAIRGRVDFDIHMRRHTPDEAATELESEGMPPDLAVAMVRRYLLKPGYQLAYTIGRRRFRRLYDTWRRRGATPAAFAGRVLAQGEIGFDHLDSIILNEY